MLNPSSAGRARPGVVGTTLDGRCHARAPGGQDLLDIWLYIAGDQPVHADRFLDRLETAAQRLASLSQIGTERPELGEGVRSFPVERYMLYYRTRSGGIEFVRVLHAFRDVTPLF